MLIFIARKNTPRPNFGGGKNYKKQRMLMHLKVHLLKPGVGVYTPEEGTEKSALWLKELICSGELQSLEQELSEILPVNSINS